MTLVQNLAHAFAPWQSLYSDSKSVASVVTGVHLVGLLFGGGLAIAADRSTLRAYRRHPSERASTLAELHAVHRPVVGMLAVLFLSGLLLAAADIGTFLTSVLFWIKLALVALLVMNGMLLYHTETRVAAQAHHSGTISNRLQHRLKLTAYASLALWLLTAITGTVLTNS